MGLGRVTVIIPTLNGGKLFRTVLQNIVTQSRRPDELLVVDSASDDDTVVTAREFGAKVIGINREDFDHGATRSMAAKRSQSEYLVYLTQDALPRDTLMLETLLAPLLHDSQIALSYGRQLPNPGASLSAKSLRQFNYPSHSEIRGFADREKRGLKTVFASNSCAAYRRKNLEEVGFFKKGLIFGEDTCVAGKLLQKGYRLAYVAEAKVFHSHNYTIVQDFRRSFDIGVLHQMESWLLDCYGKAEGEGVKYIKFELSAILKERKYHLIPSFLCRNVAKMSGYKMGSRYYALPRWVKGRISMNKAWWYK